MNFAWDVAAEHDAANGNVGVRIHARSSGVVVSELIPASLARQLAATLLIEADKIAPLPVPDALQKVRKVKS